MQAMMPLLFDLDHLPCLPVLLQATPKRILALMGVPGCVSFVAGWGALMALDYRPHF